MADGRGGQAAVARETQPSTALRLAIVGIAGGTHVGDSFARAARKVGMDCVLLDAARAFEGPRLLRSAAWHLAGRRPIKLGRFSRDVVARCCGGAWTPNVLLAAGAAPLSVHAVRELERHGIRCVIFSTDDPWNPAHRGRWHLDALPAYSIVFTPRRANIEDLRALGCRDVRHLPFGYDDALFKPPVVVHEHGPDVLFVGGADADRAAFVRDYCAAGGPRPTLVGGNWERYADLRGFHRGTQEPQALQTLTASAAINLCLVRRANRDGHVMRSFEIPAIGGFMLAEDTCEHRDLFGEEGRCVLYFSSPEMAAGKARWAMQRPDERRRMAASAYAHIAEGRHDYADRLQDIMDVACA